MAANDSGQAGSALSVFGATAPKGLKKTFQRFLLIRLFLVCVVNKFLALRGARKRILRPYYDPPIGAECQLLN